MVQITNQQLDDAAGVLIMRCLQLGADYATKLQIMRDERGWEPWQIIGACVAYVLENDLHMEVPNHPAFDPPGSRPPDEMICAKCHEPFTPQFRYQQYHDTCEQPVPVI